jgi:DNA-binding MarR family transcriptional regulator
MKTSPHYSAPTSGAHPDEMMPRTSRPNRPQVQRFGQPLSPPTAKLLDRLIGMHEDGTCLVSNQALSELLRWKMGTLAKRLKELEEAGLIQRSIDWHNTGPAKRIIHLHCLKH